MPQVDNRNSGGLPVTAGGAGGNHRGLRQIAGDFAHHPLAMAGLVVLALALLDAFVAPLLFNPGPINPEVIINPGPIHIPQRLQGLSGSHLLGTDSVGRDELARLLYGVHNSMLLVGATLALAAVVAAVVLAVVRLLGRKRWQEWARWAEVVLTPVVGLLLLRVASLVVSLQLPSGVEVHPDLFTSIFTTPRTFVLQNPLPIGTAIQNPYYYITFLNSYYYLTSLLVLVMLAGELVRFVYLLVQRVRSVRAPQPRAETTPVTPAWVSVAVPAAAIGLWVAADALLLEGLLDSYVAFPAWPIPSLGLMFGQSGVFINQAPWLVLAPLVAILVVYASLNLVGFGLRGVLLRLPQPEQHEAPRTGGLASKESS